MVVHWFSMVFNDFFKSLAYIDEAQLKRLAEPLLKSGYSKNLMELLNKE